jgi:hypothetical protein
VFVAICGLTSPLSHPGLVAGALPRYDACLQAGQTVVMPR